jgi:hypothetical protein
MAKDINKYAQNIARARYASPTSRAPQRRATIDPTLFSGKKAATGAPLASRPIEGGPALPSPQEYNPIIDAESGEDPNAPRVETQQPIENRGSSARYMLQTGGPRLDLSFLVPERANEAFDPSKAIGGENVPYQESTGIGGFFRRMLGDESNRMNIEAQQAQGAEWREAEKEAKAEERLLNRIREQNEPIQKRFDEEMKYRRDKDIRDEIKGYEDEAVRLAREGQEDVLRDADMVRKEVLAAEEGKRRDRELDIRESAIKPPRYSPIGNTGMFQTPEGELAVFEPETMRISDKMPGRAARFRMLTGAGSKAPGRSMGDVEVDRVTSKPLGASTPSPTTTTPEVPNTALFPTMGRAIGESTTEATTAVTDPLRAVGTDIYKALFSSSAQQDPEVLKRIKEREARRASTQPRFDVPLGY